MGGSALTRQQAADERVCGENGQEGGRERGAPVSRLMTYDWMTWDDLGADVKSTPPPWRLRGARGRHGGHDGLRRCLRRELQGTLLWEEV